MAVLPIVEWPDPRLRKACVPVADAADLSALAQDMLDTMYAAPGRGLAGPQVGVMQRIFVMDVAWKEGMPDPLVCLNPEITARSEVLETRSEGCLSIPGILVPVARPEAITLAWTDLDGTRHKADLTGFAATCAQHELDHLDGIITFDRLEPEARAKAETAWAEMKERL